MIVDLDQFGVTDERTEEWGGDEAQLAEREAPSEYTLLLHHYNKDVMV